LKKKKTGDDSVKQTTSSQLHGHQEDNAFVTPRTDEIVDTPNTPTSILSRTKEDQNSENQQHTKLISQKKKLLIIQMKNYINT